METQAAYTDCFSLLEECMRMTDHAVQNKKKSSINGSAQPGLESENAETDYDDDNTNNENENRESGDQQQQNADSNAYSDCYQLLDECFQVVSSPITPPGQLKNSAQTQKPNKTPPPTPKSAAKTGSAAAVAAATAARAAAAVAAAAKVKEAKAKAAAAAEAAIAAVASAKAAAAEAKARGEEKAKASKAKLAEAKANVEEARAKARALAPNAKAPPIEEPTPKRRRLEAPADTEAQEAPDSLMALDEQAHTAAAPAAATAATTTASTPSSSSSAPAPAAASDATAAAAALPKLVLDRKAPFRRVVYLMRGAPGSGKSTMARKLLAAHLDAQGVRWDPSSAVASSCGSLSRAFVLSTDDYFTVVDEAGNSEYQFNVKKLREYHPKNQTRCEVMMELGVTPLFVDNTNISAWEMKDYVLAAEKHNYHIQVVEPDDYGDEKVWDAGFLHGRIGKDAAGRATGKEIPYNTLQRMINNFEELPEGQEALLAAIKNAYSPFEKRSNEPPPAETSKSSAALPPAAAAVPRYAGLDVEAKALARLGNFDLGDEFWDGSATETDSTLMDARCREENKWTLPDRLHITVKFFGRDPPSSRTKKLVGEYFQVQVTSIVYVRGGGLMCAKCEVVGEGKQELADVAGPDWLPHVTLLFTKPWWAKDSNDLLLALEEAQDVTMEDEEGEEEEERAVDDVVVVVDSIDDDNNSNKQQRQQEDALGIEEEEDLEEEEEEEEEEDFVIDVGPFASASTAAGAKAKAKAKVAPNAGLEAALSLGSLAATPKARAPGAATATAKAKAPAARAKSAPTPSSSSASAKATAKAQSKSGKGSAAAANNSAGNSSSNNNNNSNNSNSSRRKGGAPLETETRDGLKVRVYEDLSVKGRVVDVCELQLPKPIDLGRCKYKMFT